MGVRFWPGRGSDLGGGDPDLVWARTSSGRVADQIFLGCGPYLTEKERENNFKITNLKLSSLIGYYFTRSNILTVLILAHYNRAKRCIAHRYKKCLFLLYLWFLQYSAFKINNLYATKATGCILFLFFSKPFRFFGWFNII